jgi:hypothetical protein
VNGSAWQYVCSTVAASAEHSSSIIPIPMNTFVLLMIAVGNTELR